MPEFLSYEYFNNTVLTYIIFAASLLGSLIIVKLILHFILKRVRRLAAKSKGTNDEAAVSGFIKYFKPIAYFLVVYLNLQILYLQPAVTKVLSVAVLTLVTLAGAKLTTSLVTVLLKKYWENSSKNENNQHAIKWILFFIKAVIWLIAIFLFLDNAGIKINSLITGLGIGGVAVAFAAQAILSDIFCFFTIFFDKPFELGDFIVSGDKTGTIEHIGLKTTRLRALSGEQIILSNSDLTGSRINNFKTMVKRRILFTIRVTYATDHETLRNIPALIKSVIEGVEGTSFERAHFFSYGLSSLDFEVVYYVLTNDYNAYMDINQEVNLRIKEAFDKQGIGFALPAQTVFVQAAAPNTAEEKA